MKINTLKLLPVMVVVALGFGGVVHAANTTISQTINAGTLTVDILDNNQQVVATPGVTMSAIATAPDCQDPGSSGVLGTNTQRVYVDNPEAANNGWTLSIAATDGPTTTWTDGTNNFSYNDETSGGCETGQMSIDPSGATITTDCQNCDNTGIAPGAASAFTSSVEDIELMNASAGSDDIWRGYLTGVDVNQTIPGGQPTGTYSLNLTLTVVAD